MATSDVLPNNGGASPLPPAALRERCAAAPKDSGPAAGEPPALLKKVPVPVEVLDHLWTLYSETHMAGVFGGLNEAYSAQGVQAGIVATLLAVLPEEQFREVMIRWEVDAIRLTQLLHVAGVWATPVAKGEAAGEVELDGPAAMNCN